MAKAWNKIRKKIRVIGIIIGGMGVMTALICGYKHIINLVECIVLVIAILIGLLLAPWIYNGDDMNELLMTSMSPDGTHTLEVYRVNPGATEPYCIRANVMNNGKAVTVYNVRGQAEAEVIWLSEDVAQINGVPVDVTSGECFKANALGDFSVNVQVTAEDVRWLEMTVCMGGEPRITRNCTSMPLSDETDTWGLSVRLNVLQELHWDDNLETKKAGLRVTVESADGQKITLPYISEWTAEEYGIYRFTLTGSAAEGYMLTPGDFECTVSEK